jgi:hypothetical protein
MTGLFWLASSERERQEALELSKALQQKDSRDELGIGTIRDGLADLLFPGTSTLHTRARYHLFIPWAFLCAAAETGSRPFAARVRAQETRLIAELKVTSDQRGLIGSQAGANLRRMPSALYWQGLQVWGIRGVPGTPAIVEQLMQRGARRVERDNDGEPLDPETASVWHHNLPTPPVDFPSAATFAMSCDEADFLADRLRTEPGTRGSALAQLVGLRGGADAAAMIWEHPLLPALDSETRVIVDQARRASLLIHGATLLYNVILAAMRESAELEQEHRARFELWAADAEQSIRDLVEWDLEELWTTLGGRVPFQTRHFVTQWQRLVAGHAVESLVDSVEARALITARERAMKGPTARTVNQKALDQWGGASAIHALDFRWSTALGLIADIRDGLETGHAQN